MPAFILRRVLQSFAVMAVVGLIAFSLFNFVGDPVVFMVGQDATVQEKQKLRRDLGLDQPFPVQFVRFVDHAVRGDFGLSLRQLRPVSTLLKERLPATLELSIAAGLLALAVGIPLGVYTALRRDTWLSHLLLAGSLVGVSLPTFLIGILLILVFAVILGWLPSFGRGDTVALGWWTTGLLTRSGQKALVLPAITLSLFQMTLIMRLVRSEMLEVLRTDYIRFARARGLTDRSIHFSHALKNTLVPVITITGLQLGAIIAFAIITETVFQWPGMGLLFIQAVNFADIPVMAAYLCLIALVFVLINLVVDLLYYAVDPRLRVERVAGQLNGTLKGAMLNPVEHIHRWHADFTALRRDLHMHPELGFEEHRTAKLVCERLAALGIEHHAGIGRTGVVAVIRGRSDAQRPARRPAGRHGRAADAGGERLRAQIALRRADARLRPRRPHHDAARRGALSRTRRAISTASRISSSSPARKAMPAPRR